MPIRRFLGETTTGTPVSPSAAEPVNAAAESNAEVTESNPEQVHEEDSVPATLIRCATVLHLETYQLIGAIIEPMGVTFAPVTTWVRSVLPEVVVDTFKSVDGLMDSMLTTLDTNVVPEALKRVPNHVQAQAEAQATSEEA